MTQNKQTIKVSVEFELFPAIMEAQLDAKSSDIDDIKLSLKEELEMLEKFGIKFIKFKENE